MQAKPEGGEQAERDRPLPRRPHGFNADYRPTYRKETAEDGWQKMLAWFKKNGVASANSRSSHLFFIQALIHEAETDRATRKSGRALDGDEIVTPPLGLSARIQAKCPPSHILLQTRYDGDSLGPMP